MLAMLIGAHLIGDLILQNHWMQAKSKSSFTCTVHVVAYSIPFWTLWSCNVVTWPIVLAILVEHWLQDRYALHLWWMRRFGQSPVTKWPTGPFCVDQAFHIGFMWELVLLIGHW